VIVRAEEPKVIDQKKETELRDKNSEKTNS
jgi:hypothetical protein